MAIGAIWDDIWDEAIWDTTIWSQDAVEPGGDEDLRGLVREIVRDVIREMVRDIS